jgi:hypothetical protein
MKCLFIDYHSTATTDVAMVLKDIGYNVTSWNMSNHNWIFNKKKSDIIFLNNIPLDKFYFDIGKDFWKFHKNELEEYDFFVTGHTPCLSLLLSETNKPIIVCITTRYEHPFTGDSEEWKRFNDYLIKGYEKGRLHFVANNNYDANYFFHYTGIKPKIIQSLCHYHEGMWKKSKEEFVLYSKLSITSQGIVDLKSKGRYDWGDWYSYAGVFCVPYQVSTMSLFEFSTAGIPVLYPSIEETLDLRSRFPNHVLSEISWRTVSNKYANQEYKKMCVFGEMPSPNSLDNDSMKEWLKYSDCYTPWMNNVIGNNSNFSYETKKSYFINNWKSILENALKEN